MMDSIQKHIYPGRPPPDSRLGPDLSQKPRGHPTFPFLRCKMPLAALSLPILILN